MDKKIKVVCISIFLILTLLAGRLGYLQLFKGEQLSEEAAIQQWAQIPEQANRGQITDRNFYSLTYGGERPLAVINPTLVEDGNGMYRLLKPFCTMTPKEFQQRLAGKGIFAIPLTEEPDCSQTPGLIFTQSSKRYNKDSAASHLLGYCNETKGIAGLEAAFDSILTDGGGMFAGTVTDATGTAISDFSSYENPEEERNLRLTLDATLQNILEEIGDKKILQGAIVLLDVQTSDLLAMASFPDFDQTKIEEYLSSPEGNLLNRALCTYDAGSVFKIIVAAAALEQGITIEEYTCEGAVSVGETQVTCYHNIPHGTLTFQEAFAKSCNCYFIELGKKLGSDAILDMAKHFGIGTPYHLFENSGEQTDTTGQKETYYEGDIANLSIGQGDVSLTPLRCAELSAIVASGGFKHKVNLVHSVSDGNHNTLKKLNSFRRERVISKETANQLQSMMLMTTLCGTAKGLSLEASGGAGCKTGTAQTGWSDGEETTKVHSWITGFFPAEHPRYALCVFVENGENISVSASEIFEECVTKITNNTISRKK